MEVFTFNPSGAESLDDFNARLSDFCIGNEDNLVVGVVSSLAGPTLAVSLSQMDDLPFVPPMAVLPVIAAVNVGDALELERILTETVEAIRAKHTEDDPRIPVEVRLHTNEAGAGFALFLVNVGSIEPEDGSDAE